MIDCNLVPWTKNIRTYLLLCDLCWEIDFDTPEQKYLMGQIIGIFEN